MPVKTEIKETTLFAYISGDIDHHTAKEIRETVDAEIKAVSPELLVLDFKDVTFMDSSGIGLVMGRYKILSANGAALAVTNPSPQIYKVMRLAGLDRLAKLEKGDIKNEITK